MIALTLATVAGCGGDDTTATAAISTASFCDDFMKQAPADRQSATVRIATEMGMQNPTSPEWLSTLEGRCSAAPDLKLGDFFNHFK